MKFSSSLNLLKRVPADMLVLPFWKGKGKQAIPAGNLEKISSLLSASLETGDFQGKDGEFLILYLNGQKEKRFALLGLGDEEKITTEKLRRAYGNVTKGCLSKKCKSLNLLMPKISSLSEECVVQGIAEGLLLANYVFDKLKNHSLKDNPTVLLQNVHLIGASKNSVALATKYAGISEGVYLTRDLVNGNADTITPQYLGHLAQSLAKKHPHIKTTVFNKRQIEQEKMALLLAVNRGSSHEPVFVIMEYKGNPKSTDNPVFVGKGITYDTGGLNIKTGGMETMKCDMGGAALCLGTICAAATIGLKANFTVVFPATENSVSELSYKPGDVYSSYLGKTVEIGNTDAEGRLVLADALAYASQNLNPSCLIDFATLTGAIEIALGSEATGLMSNNDALAEALMHAGSETFERLWRMPLYEEYRDLLKSDVADIRNIGGRSASSITAALFLQEFVGKDIPWAHCDIASTAYLTESKRYLPKHATGVGVRLLISFLEKLNKGKA